MNKLFLSISIAFAACSSSPKKDTTETPVQQIVQAPVSQFENIEKGKVLTVKCKSDTSNSYALYIPSSYNCNSASPVLFFFDAHGAGNLPLIKYKELAEKFGYIFAGSNNSKNGQTGETNGKFAGNMMDDLQTRVNIDNKRIYTSGFSGGSRVASTVAIFRGGINTVIGLGAGFPNLEKPIENKFNYVGIAGDEDFNYTEMEDLEKMLSETPVEHIFLPFKGKHEWCPVSTMEQAFTWLQLKAMKQNLIQKNDTLIAAYSSSSQNVLENLITNKKEVEALTLAKQMLNSLNGLSNVDKLSSTIAELEKSDNVKKAKARTEELSKAEKALKDQYLNAMALKDAAWWRTETQHMNDAKKFPADQLAMNKRIMSFLSLACYMNINQMLHSNQVKEAENYITIYKIIDPTNPEAPYLQATIYLSQNEDNKAIAELKNAAKIGFKEYDRFIRDFQKYTTLTEVGAIAKQIQDNAAKDQE